MHNEHKYADYYKAGFNSVIEKNAWIFSAPIATSGVLHSTRLLPRRTSQIITGEDIEDNKKNRLLTALQIALLLSGGLWSLGWGGSALKELGANISLLAKKNMKGGLKLLNPAEKELRRIMEIPAWKRHAKGAGKIWKPLKPFGYILGGIGQPINKLENLIAKGTVRALGSKALSVGNYLQELPNKNIIFANRAVKAMGNPLALAPFLVGSAIIPELDKAEEPKINDIGVPNE